MDENNLLILIIILLVLLLMVILAAASKIRPKKGRRRGAGTKTTTGPGTVRPEGTTGGSYGSFGPEGPEVVPNYDHNAAYARPKPDRPSADTDPGHDIVKIFVDRGRSDLMICPNCDAENIRGESRCISCDYPL